MIFAPNRAGVLCLARKRAGAYVLNHTKPETPRMRLRPLAIALLGFAAAPLLAFAAEPPPPAAHRALYELTMESARGANVSAAKGTMAYELTDACDGWATRQRLSLTITNRDGQDIDLVSDYATWESKDGLKMRFKMRQTTDTALTDQAEGEAVLNGPGGAGSIHYTVPEEKDLPLPAGTLFPTAHTQAIIAAAEAGKKFISLPIFDGTSDKGVQDSSVAIISWDPPGPAPDPALAALPSGRVRIAFFDRTPSTAKKDKPAGSPDYEVGMRYWSNSVANDLNMDFTDFVMSGKMKEFKLQPSHC